MGPIKPKQIADRILYERNNIYNMCSLKSGEYLGKIKLVPKKDSLHISDIKSYYPQDPKRHVGTSLIEFAKNLSKKMGKEGNLSAWAYNYEYGGKPSPQFFRKQGFTTNNEVYDHIIDMTIECGEEVPPLMRQGISMDYYARGKRAKQ